MKTPAEKKEIERLRKQAYRARIKEQNPEEFLQKQKQEKANQRAKRKEIIPIEVKEQPKKSVKIKVIKKEQDIQEQPKKKVKIIRKANLPPPLPATLPEDIEEPPPLPITKPPKLKKTKIDNLQLLKNVYKNFSNTSNLKPTINTATDTITQYVNTVARLYNAMYKEFKGDISFLNDINKIKNFIYDNYAQQNTRIQYFKSIVGVLRRMRPLEEYKTIADTYSDLMMNAKNGYEEKSGENKLTEKEEKNFTNWEDIVNMNTSNLTPTEDLIYNLYTSIPPRRCVDYSLMKLIKDVSKNEIDTLPTEYNYMIINDNKPISLVYNNYKTKKHYGQFIIDLENYDTSLMPYINISKLNKSINNFISNTNIKTGDLLFGTSKNTPYKDWSTKLYGIFKNSKRKVSCNVLRHSFITDFYSQKNISLNKMKLIASYMSHSPTEALKYRRFTDWKDDVELKASKIMKKLKVKTI